MRSSRQSRKQLGLHGDNEYCLELEVMGSIANSSRAEKCGTTSSRKEATADDGVQNVSFSLHTRSVPDHSSRTSDDPSVVKSDRLHACLLSPVRKTESVTRLANTEACWQKSFGIASPKQIATATPYQDRNQKHEATQNRKIKPARLARSPLRCKNRATTNKRSLV